jgi:hypothetical protein
MTDDNTSAEPRGPLGNTGDGNTGVLADEQGISNRPGDHAQDTDNDPDDEAPDEDDDDESDDDELEDDAEGDETDVTDPETEPGKPI